MFFQRMVAFDKHVIPRIHSPEFKCRNLQKGHLFKIIDLLKPKSLPLTTKNHRLEAFPGISVFSQQSWVGLWALYLEVCILVNYSKSNGSLLRDSFWGTTRHVFRAKLALPAVTLLVIQVWRT